MRPRESAVCCGTTARVLAPGVHPEVSIDWKSSHRPLDSPRSTPILRPSQAKAHHDRSAIHRPRRSPGQDAHAEACCCACCCACFYAHAEAHASRSQEHAGLGPSLNGTDPVSPPTPAPCRRRSLLAVVLGIPSPETRRLETPVSPLIFRVPTEWNLALREVRPTRRQPAIRQENPPENSEGNRP